MTVPSHITHILHDRLKDKLCVVSLSLSLYRLLRVCHSRFGRADRIVLLSLSLFLWQSRIKYQKIYVLSCGLSLCCTPLAASTHTHTRRINRAMWNKQKEMSKCNCNPFVICKWKIIQAVTDTLWLWHNVRLSRQALPHNVTWMHHQKKGTGKTSEKKIFLYKYRKWEEISV